MCVFALAICVAGGLCDFIDFATTAIAVATSYESIVYVKQGFPH